MPIRALENLPAEGITCHAALMSFSGQQDIFDLIKTSATLDPCLTEIKVDVFIPYPPIVERLRKPGLIPEEHVYFPSKTRPLAR